jgi:phosphoglycolate phosphatase-like HAD superfamily hydrolase
MQKLVLFDIDGTLVLTGRAGVRALEQAFGEVFGVEGALEGVALAGRTDRAILEDALRRCDPAGSIDCAPLDRLRSSYLAHLATTIAEDRPDKRVLPGVRPLLEALDRRPSVEMALLTGNLEEGARIKLEHFDLWRYFGWGVFGGETTDRNALMAEALRTARRRGVGLAGVETIFVVGDTPHDVACAKSVGARAIGVATGPYDANALRTSGADAVFDDLADTAALLKLLG